MNRVWRGHILTRVASIIVQSQYMSQPVASLGGKEQHSAVDKVIYRIKEVSMTHLPERLASQRALVKIAIAANHDGLC